jgi:hypothetical protein
MSALASQAISHTSPARKHTPEVHAVPVSHLSSQTVSLAESSIQRKASCACGGGCPACDKESVLGVQTKMAISSPGDQYEQEADKVADQVMRMPDPMLQRQCEICSNASAPSASNGGEPRILLKANGEGGADGAPDFTSRLGSGMPLDAASRAYFEPRFGRDFGDVRIHNGPLATTAAANIQARAFTFGADVVFAAREHDPGSDGGKRLLAHELAHVVQQSGGDGVRVGERHGLSPIVHGDRIYRQRAEGNVCSLRSPLYGWDNIRNISRERLRAAGFVFCGPDRDFDPELWERWVHPTKGVLHFQVKWKDEPAPPPPDDRQKRCADPCMAKTDDEAACKKCCEESIPAADTQCRRTCEVACSMMLSAGPSGEPSSEPAPDEEME